MRFLAIFLIACTMLGCTTQDVSINTSYSWEKRYSKKDKIVVNSQVIDVDDNQVWILTSKTLYNLITTANGKNITVKEESK